MNYINTKSTMLGLTFLGMVICYFIGKFFSLPTFYPFVLIPIVASNLSHFLKSGWKLFLFAAVPILYLLLTATEPVTHWLALGSLGASLAVFNIFYVSNPNSNDLYLVDIVLCFLALVFTSLFIISCVKHQDYIVSMLDLETFMGTFFRTAHALRFKMTYFYDPFEEGHMSKVNLSFASLVGIWLSLRMRLTLIPKKYFVLCFIPLILSLILTSCRLPVGVITFVLLATYIKQSKWFTYLVMAILILLPLAIPTLSKPFLNGRQKLYLESFKNLELTGHGLGKSKFLASELKRKDKTQHLHNIHLEVAYDFGIMFYLMSLGTLLFFLFKTRALITTFMIFIVFSLSYTIYSPWTWMIISLGLIADNIKVKRFSFVLNQKRVEVAT